MALKHSLMDYTVCETSTGSSGATRQGSDKVSQSATTSYRVDVQPTQVDGVTGVTPSDVPTELIRSLPELPSVNGSTYYYGGVVNPYLICSGKQVERDNERRLSFNVTINWASPDPSDSEKGGTEEQSDPPANLTDIEPTVAHQIVAKQIPMWVDKNGKQCWRLPGTGTPFSTPVVETIPILTIIVTQYEPFIAYDTMMARSFKLNSETYRGKGPGSWLTGAVNATEVKVQLASGEVSAAKVTYTMTLSEAVFDTVVTNEPLGTTEGTEYFYGHDQTKPLVDDHHIGRFVDDGQSKRVTPTLKYDNAGEAISDDRTTGYIYEGAFSDTVAAANSAGDLRTPVGTNKPVYGAAPDGPDKPSYMFFQSQDSISFSFLQA